ETVLGVLPGHFLTKKGLGIRAIKICVFSILLGLIFSFLFAFLNLNFSRFVFAFLREYLVFFLGAFCGILVFSDERKIEGILIFVLSGALGFFALRFPGEGQVFVAFLGFFSLSQILLSRIKRMKKQREKDEEVDNSIILLSFLGAFLGWVCDFFPAIATPAQIATLVFPIVKGPESFLSITSAISSSHAINSLVSLISIGKARTGVTLEIIEIVNRENVLFYLAISATSFFISITILLISINKIVNFLQKINFLYLNALLGVYIFVLSAFYGVFGIVLLITTTCVGILAQLIGARRIHMMSFLLVPVMVNLLS
ncbi:MAG: tripartite tricarboxylate transporter permease, partial [Candidatus Aenigmatarchaeota archaeon]